MKQTKALFFDVDSTLYSHRVHDFPQTTQQALENLRKRGYRIAVATSRCRYETYNLPHFFQTFPFDAKIYDGGALVMANDCVLHASPIPVHEVERLVKLSEEEGFTMRYSTLDGNYFHRECAWHIKDEFFRLYLNMPTIKPYEGEETFNMLAFVQNDVQREKLYTHMKGCSIVEHAGGTYEITANGIDKSIGVRCLCDYWHISLDETVCFGDGANDVGMLQAAGIGIAMGNGNSKAKEAADRVCGAIDEDGLYNICKELHLF